MVAWNRNADISAYNSLGFKVTAERFLQVTEVGQLHDALNEVVENKWPLLIIGGGSNLVLHDELPGAVINVATSGINVLADDEDQAIVEVGAGENWHGFVSHLLEMGLHGLENLALIPGSVGAAPVQNIGAYGVELADCFHSLTAYDRETGELVQISAEQCQFSYRNSIFKSSEKGRYIIWRVRFNLSSIFTPNLSYKGLTDYLSDQGVEHPTAHQVYTAVCEVRKQKLPVPSELGNAGSFFENPVVPEAQFQALKASFPDLVAYADKPGHFKLAAGWMIDKAGWKGYRDGAVGVYEKQALVLVHFGAGSATELLALADRIKASVSEKFNVSLEMEPRIYPHR